MQPGKQGGEIGSIGSMQRRRWTRQSRAKPKLDAVPRNVRASLIRLLALFVLALVANAPASAHQGYFTRVEKIVLPDGQPGEMRLLHTDGIIVSDPARIVVLDGSGRLLARSRYSWTLSLLCEDGGRCRGLDSAAGVVLELDPASFRGDGPFVPDARERGAAALSSVERGLRRMGLQGPRGTA